MSDALSHEVVLGDTLSWLWDTVAEPVLTALESESFLRRLWWIPTGPMTLFPLHAAGRKVNVLDRVVSSYSATISAMTNARAAASQAPRPGTGLVIVPQSATERASLPSADREARAIAGMLPSAQVLAGSDATLQHALSALPGAQVLHFAGHGRYDSTSPGASTLLLSDGQLKLPLAVEALKRSHPQLAFLSACSTSHMPSLSTGEAVNLGMVMQLAGYRHTVSTLWEVNDRTLADIAQDFYRRLTGESLNLESSATALNAVTRSFRERYPHIPSLWAAHIHVGP
jgi:CHAT domain-containing protein